MSLVKIKSENNSNQNLNIDISEIIKMDDLKRKRTMNDVFVKIFDCVDNDNESQWENITHIINDITLNLHNLKCDETISKLLYKIKLFTIKNDDIVDGFLELIYEFVNFKPFYYKDILNKILIPSFYGNPKSTYDNPKSTYDSHVNDSEMMSNSKSTGDNPKSTGDNHISDCEMILFNKIHTLLCRLKSAVLNFEGFSLKSFEKMFPFHTTATIHSYVCYIYNLLKAYDYFEEKQNIIFIIIDKLFWVDTLCPKLMNQDQEIFKIDDCDELKNKMLNLLDHSINQILVFVDEKVNNKDDDKLALFHVFFSAFFKFIINSKNCSHLQYVIFYFCSKDKILAKEMINRLWCQTLNTELQYEIRERAIYYTGGLLINAKYVSISDIVSFIDTATRGVHLYINSNKNNQNNCTNNKEDIIYSLICQTVFYIFCFRHLEFDHFSIKSIKNMNIQKIVSSELNPLKHCPLCISSKFSDLARHYQICYCSTIVETNRKNNKSKNIQDYLQSNVKNYHLFNSYTLPVSGKKIEPISIQYLIENEENTIDFTGRHSDVDSDVIMSSYNSSFTMKKSLWENLLSDSSPGINEIKRTNNEINAINDWSMSD